MANDTNHLDSMELDEFGDLTVVAKSGVQYLKLDESWYRLVDADYHKRVVGDPIESWDLDTLQPVALVADADHDILSNSGYCDVCGIRAVEDPGGRLTHEWSPS